MGLEDFERQLAEEKARDSNHSTSRKRSRSRDRERERHRDRERRHRHHHHHHHHHHSSHGSHGHQDRDLRDDESRRRHKRRRHDDDEKERRREERERPGSASPTTAPVPAVEKKVKVFDSGSSEEDEWVEKGADTAPPEEDILDQRDQDLRKETGPQRDAWMREPSALDIDYVQSRKPKPQPGQFVGAKDNHEFKVHETEVSQHLADLQRDFDSDAGEGENTVEAGDGVVNDEPAQHTVNYVFGDSGSSWRMTKLKAVYRHAEENGKNVDEVALERYGDLRDFDDAREEERELDRRKMYGAEYVGMEKPSGELFQDRKMKAGIRREQSTKQESETPSLPQGEPIPEATKPATTVVLDSTGLNKLKAQMMKAKLRSASNAAQLEEEYKLAEAASLANTKQPDVIVLDNMENRMLAGGRGGEVSAVSGKRGRERGLVVENEDMSIDDMVRQEKRTRGAAGGEGRAFADRIARDGKFVDDLDYMDDNAAKLSRKVLQSDTQLRSTAIGDFQKMQRVLDACPLCHHEERSNAAPVAPVVSLATRTYLTLPTEPEITKSPAPGAIVVPIQHRLNLLECDDDEWEEMRNFMKALTRLYDSHGRGVVFYENAAHMHSRRGHAALVAVPLPPHLAATAPAYFKEAILAADEQWSQHKPVIDTLSLSERQGYGKNAFRKSMAKEMPYFHVWFGLDGGLGHVVEDERRWPKGDLFAREIIGGMLDRGPETIKKQGRWEGRDAKRVEGFRRRWEQWDWTAALVDAQ